MQDYLSRLRGAKETIASISAFDPLQADLYDLQIQDDDLQMLQTFMTNNELPPNLPKQDRIYFKNLVEKAFQDKNKMVWVRLEDFNYPRTVLNLPARFRKEAMCEAHEGGSQCNSQNIPENLHLLMLAEENTKTSASAARSKKNPQTSGLHWPLFPFWTVQISGFMQIFLTQ
jgi:hypothetical protein